MPNHEAREQHVATPAGAVCGVNVAFAVVGSKWKPTILWQLDQGIHRFGQLRRALGDVTEKVLAEQLQQLEVDGLISRTEWEGYPRRVEYALTAEGAQLNDALEAVAAWGDRHHARRLTPSARSG